jgi:hypothetical protein
MPAGRFFYAPRGPKLSEPRHAENSAPFTRILASAQHCGSACHSSPWRDSESEGRLPFIWTCCGCSPPVHGSVARACFGAAGREQQASGHAAHAPLEDDPAVRNCQDHWLSRRRLKERVPLCRIKQLLVPQARNIFKFVNVVATVVHRGH